MNGLELSRAYYETFGRPMLEERFPAASSVQTLVHLLYQASEITVCKSCGILVPVLIRSRK